MGQFRYMEVSQWVDWHWIVPRDQVVWELRRFTTLDPVATSATRGTSRTGHALMYGDSIKIELVGGAVERAA
jgi:hypothetical protein